MDIHSQLPSLENQFLTSGIGRSRVSTWFPSNQLLASRHKHKEEGYYPFLPPLSSVDIPLACLLYPTDLGSGTALHPNSLSSNFSLVTPFKTSFLCSSAHKAIFILPLKNRPQVHVDNITPYIHGPHLPTPFACPRN